MERMREQGLPTRRDIIASAAAGAGVLLAGKLAGAQAARSPGRIDLHHHYFPPAFLDAQRDAAVRQNRPAAPGASLEGWSKARTIEAMDRYGVATGILFDFDAGPMAREHGRNQASRPRMQRVRGRDDARPSGPFRPVRGAAAARSRRGAARDRICVRHAPRRWRRHYDELRDLDRHDLAGRRIACARLRRVEPP